MSSRVARLYDRLAGLYEFSMFLAGYHRLLRHGIEQLASRDSVSTRNGILDIGCGTGLSAKILSENFPNSRIVGMDLSEKMLNRFAKTNYPSFIGDFNNPSTIQPFGSTQGTLQEHAPFSLAVSAASISEYGSPRAVSFVEDLLSDDGSMLVIGMRDNIVSRMTGRCWGYKPSGVQKMRTYMDEANFSQIGEMPVSHLRFPLLSFHKFILYAKK
ncbi:MAG: class I SAM-dependent methyltransferase [Candidatus Woesearchaeota archaeon]